MRMLEGFSGSGRLARTFRAGGWEADTVDIKDGQDIMDWEPEERYDYCHFAPPCQEYSALGLTHSDEGWKAVWKADAALWLRSLELIRTIAPTHWTIENVKASQWVWGKAPYHYGPFFLWGWFPFHFMPKVPWTHSFKGTHNFTRSGGKRWNESLTAEERATYPQSFCDAIFQACNEAPMLKQEILAVQAAEAKATEGSGD